MWDWYEYNQQEYNQFYFSSYKSATYSGLSISCTSILVDFVVKSIHEIKCTSKYSLGMCQQMLLMWLLLMNLLVLKTVNLIHQIHKIDAYHYK